MGDANQALRFRRLPLACECGRVPSHLTSVGLTSAHDLVIYWTCPACRQPVYLIKPLTDCWRACPGDRASSEDGPARRACEFRPGDVRFLHSIRVSLPGDDTP